jgi:RNA polymerase sigma-70 factor (ECF subfamily)
METAFVQLLLGIQIRLEAFLQSIVMDRGVVDELLQRTNVIICQKAGEFADGTDFEAWACRIAHYEVLAYRRGFARERERLIFDDEQLQLVAAAVEGEQTDLDAQLQVLRKCVGGLPEKQRDLIHHRYALGRPITQIAGRLGRPVGSVRQTLFRLRLLLLACIRKNLETERHG